jgi:hypothetical protein
MFGIANGVSQCHFAKVLPVTAFRRPIRETRSKTMNSVTGREAWSASPTFGPMTGKKVAGDRQ